MIHSGKRKGRYHRGRNDNAAWRASHPEFFRTAEPRYHKPDFRILSVTNEHWGQTASWKKKDGVWHCYSAGPKLLWMVGKTTSEAHVELLRLGASWKWYKSDQTPLNISTTP